MDLKTGMVEDKLNEPVLASVILCGSAQGTDGNAWSPKWLIVTSCS